MQLMAIKVVLLQCLEAVIAFMALESQAVFYGCPAVLRFAQKYASPKAKRLTDRGSTAFHGAVTYQSSERVRLVIITSISGLPSERKLLDKMSWAVDGSPCIMAQVSL